MADTRSRSTIVVVSVGVVVIALLAALSAGLRSRAGDATGAVREASSARTSTTPIGMTVTNSLPLDIVVSATEVFSYDYTGVAPDDPEAFGSRSLVTGTAASAVLGLNTNVSRGTFTLRVADNAGVQVGSVAIGRGYVGYTCTSVTQGAVTVRDCSQRNVWWFDSAVPRSSSSSCPSSNTREIGSFTDAAGVTQKVSVRATCSTTVDLDAGEIGATTFTLTAAPVPTK